MIDVAVDVSVAIAYGYTGWRIGTVPTVDALRHGRHAFSVWWVALAFTGALAALVSAMPAFGRSDVALQAALELPLVAAFTVATSALVYYLLFLFTGRRALLAPIVAIYGLYLLYRALTALANPVVAIDASAWRPLLVRGISKSRPPASYVRITERPDAIRAGLSGLKAGGALAAAALTVGFASAPR